MPEIPEQYIIEGLNTLGHVRLNDVTEAVDFQTPKGTKFFLARDMMGIQFCAEGMVWPSTKGLPSMEDAMNHLKENLEEAIAFFDSGTPSKQFGLGDVFLAAAIAGQREGT